MDIYEYTARDYSGREHRGTVSASSEVEARERLRGKELFATSLRRRERGLLRSLVRIVRPAR